MFKYTSKDVLRFWSKVALTANDDLCWEWQAGKDKDGYGTFWLNSLNSNMRATRFSFEISNGYSPGDLNVCHTCDNPSCVNPKHFFLGNNAVNQHDKVLKGRQLKHESHNLAKLTWHEVDEIRERFAGSDITYVALAKEYGMCRTSIAAIIKHEIWRKS